MSNSHSQREKSDEEFSNFSEATENRNEDVIIPTIQNDSESTPTTTTITSGTPKPRIKFTTDSTVPSEKLYENISRCRMTLKYINSVKRKDWNQDAKQLEKLEESYENKTRLAYEKKEVIKKILEGTITAREIKRLRTGKKMKQDFSLFESLIQGISIEMGNVVANIARYRINLFVVDFIYFIFVFLFVILPELLLRHSGVYVAHQNFIYCEKIDDWSPIGGYPFYKTPKSEFEVNSRSDAEELKRLIIDILTGGPTIEKTILFIHNYSGTPFRFFSPTDRFYFPKKFMYLLTIWSLIIMKILFLYLILGRKYKTDARSKRRAFNSLVFAGFDLSQTNARTIASTKKYCRRALKNFVDVVKYFMVHNEPPKTKTSINFIRAIVWIAWLLVQIAFIYIMVVISKVKLDGGANSTEMQQTIYRLLITAIFSLFYFIFPPIFKFLARFEKYSVNALINITIIRSMSFKIVPVFMAIVPLRLSDNNVCRCSPMYIGPKLYQILLAVIAGEMIYVTIFQPLFFLTIRLFRKNYRPKYDTIDQLISIIFFQTSMMVASPYFPFAPLFGAFYFFFMFFLQKWGDRITQMQPPGFYQHSHVIVMLHIILILTGFYAGQIFLIMMDYKVDNCGIFRNYDEYDDIYSMIADELKIKLDLFDNLPAFFRARTMFYIASYFAIYFMFLFIITKKVDKQKKRGLKRAIKEINAEGREEPQSPLLNI